MARKILLADDSVTAQNMGRKILADAGYEVITVNNGSAALKKIAELKPDLIVLDVYMPGYSGLEVCQRLKEAQETARIPVLLTVGKLEPFKPEEAKRVRADAFIVKPFEASELLGAITRMEDRIVPRSEPSKPGRFARAIAAQEEAGRESTDADSGWKSRIGFPGKKKTKKEEADDDAQSAADIAALDRKANGRSAGQKDDRSEQTAKSKSAAADESRTQAGLSAAAGGAEVTASGLPKDITEEEMAALAAAAAQMQAGTPAQSPAEPATSAAIVEAAPAPQMESREAEPREAEASRIEETKHRDEKAIEARAEDAPAAVAAEESTGATFAAHHGEERRIEDRRAAAPDIEERKIEEKIEEKKIEETVTLAAQAKPESKSEREAPVLPHADLIAAIAALEPVNGWDAVRSESETGSTTAGQVVVPAIATALSREARWTAVPSAIDPGDAGISLELEMQKAYAAFAAAEANLPGFVSSPPVAAPAFESFAAAHAAPEPSAAAEILPTPSPEPELAPAVSAVTSTRAEEPAATEEFTPAAAPYSEAPAPVQVEPEPAAPVPPVLESTAQPEAPAAAIAPEPARYEPVAEPAHAAEESIAATAEATSNPSAYEAQPAAQTTPAVAETTAADSDSAAGGRPDMAAKRESELAETTAAAWASWRQIRESGDSRAPEASKASKREEEDDEPAPSPDSAAMAAAAGAEKAPAETPAAADADPDGIASIVDSVLADLRPKIVAEISRKLGGKK